MPECKAGILQPFPQNLSLDSDRFAVSALKNLHAPIPENAYQQIASLGERKGASVRHLLIAHFLQGEFPQCTSDMCSANALQVPEPATDVSAAQWFPVDDLPSLEGVEMHLSLGSMESLPTIRV